MYLLPRSSAPKSSGRHPGVNPAVAKQAGQLMEQQMSRRPRPAFSVEVPYSEYEQCARDKSFGR